MAVEWVLPSGGWRGTEQTARVGERAFIMRVCVWLEWYGHSGCRRRAMKSGARNYVYVVRRQTGAGVHGRDRFVVGGYAVIR